MNEEWREFGPENCYRVSNFGNIESRLTSGCVKNAMRRDWARLTPHRGRTDNHGGYYWSVSSKAICGKNKQKRVHRIVAEMFIENRENLKEVNHIDGNRDNNNALNLEWCSRQHNASNASKRGAFKNIGCFSGKFTPETPLAVLTMNMAGFSNTKIANMYECNQSNISNMLACKKQNSFFPTGIMADLRKRHSFKKDQIHSLMEPMNGQ